MTAFLHGLCLTVALGIPLASQIHQWVHRSTPPRPVRVLQRLGLVINERAHRRHHEYSTLNDYCIVSGWWNGVLRHFGVFRRLESLLEDRAGVSITRDADSPGLSSDQPHQRTGVIPSL